MKKVIQKPKKKPATRTMASAKEELRSRFVKQKALKTASLTCPHCHTWENARQFYKLPVSSTNTHLIGSLPATVQVYGCPNCKTVFIAG